MKAHVAPHVASGSLKKPEDQKKSGAVVTSWCQQQKRQSVSALLYWLTVVLSTKFSSSSLRRVVSSLTGKIQIWPGSSLQTLQLLLQPPTETFTHDSRLYFLPDKLTNQASLLFSVWQLRAPPTSKKEAEGDKPITPSVYLLPLTGGEGGVHSDKM